MHRLANLFFRRGVAEQIRDEKGAEFTADTVRKCLKKIDVTTLNIESGSLWGNGTIESFAS